MPINNIYVCNFLESRKLYVSSTILVIVFSNKNCKNVRFLPEMIENMIYDGTWFADRKREVLHSVKNVTQI